MDFYNHAVHTAPVITTLLESMVTFHLPPSNLKIGLICVWFFSSIYVCWILWIVYYANFWVYPVLKALSGIHRVLFFIGTYLFVALLYWSGVTLTKVWWRKELMEMDTKSSLSKENLVVKTV